MNWLIWREYRLNRLILIAGVVLLLLPYLLGITVLCWPKTQALTASRIAELFSFAALYSLGLSQVTMALLGGNAIAGERADRSAEFIAYLPLPRIRLLSGKLSLTFFAVAVIWVTNLLVLLIVASWIQELQSVINELYMVPCYIAITGLVFYGVSWLISSFQSSPTFAVGGGLITPLLVFLGLQAVVWWTMDVKAYSQFIENGYLGNGYAAICLTLALVCFSIGTWYYLKRIEP